MRERPMIFTALAVQAILDGRKTQTRRLIIPQPNENGFVRTSLVSCDDCGNRYERAPRKCQCGCTLFKSVEVNVLTCPGECRFGRPGDRLWLKETWAMTKNTKKTQAYVYRADNPKVKIKRWKSAMLMPRRASRINLEITEVRVARLQDITDSDAKAEGIRLWSHHGLYSADPTKLWGNGDIGRTPVEGYQTLWDSLNAKRGFGWKTNPCVYVISFKRI